MTTEPNRTPAPTRIDVLRQLQRQTEALDAIVAMAKETNEMLKLITEASIDILGIAQAQSGERVADPGAEAVPELELTPPPPHAPRYSERITLRTFVRQEVARGSKKQAFELLEDFGQIDPDLRHPLCASIMKEGPERAVEKMLSRFRGDPLPKRSYRRRTTD